MHFLDLLCKLACTNERMQTFNSIRSEYRSWKPIKQHDILFREIKVKCLHASLIQSVTLDDSAERSVNVWKWWEIFLSHCFCCSGYCYSAAHHKRSIHSEFIGAKCKESEVAFEHLLLTFTRPIDGKTGKWLTICLIRVFCNKLKAISCELQYPTLYNQTGKHYNNYGRIIRSGKRSSWKFPLNNLSVFDIESIKSTTNQYVYEWNVILQLDSIHHR